MATEQQDKPANRMYVHAKNGKNDHGRFQKGDKARGAYSAELVRSYVDTGILVPMPVDKKGEQDGGH